MNCRHPSKFGRSAKESLSGPVLIRGDRDTDRENVDPAVHGWMWFGETASGNRKSGGEGGQGQGKEE